jgi:hypothetical protein
MDNAPYHGKTDVPSSSARKPVMYNWLRANLPPAKLEGFKPEKEYRKPELWGMIKGMKATNKFYLIDKLAMEHGHTVVR